MKIDHILKLARLEIGKDEKRGLEKEFSAILNFVKKIEEIKIAKTKLAVKKRDVRNMMREDREQKIRGREQKIQKLLKLAPEIKGRHVKTKQIL